MTIKEDLQWRYATKVFDKDKKISENDLNIILDSLILTASSFGLQPWKFVVVENPIIREKLIPCSWNQRQVADASHLIVLAAPTTFNTQNIEEYIQSTAQIRNQNASDLNAYKDMMISFISKMDQSELNIWMVKQIYIALGNLLTVTATMKIDSCPMEGFDASQYDTILGLTDKKLKSIVICPIGYRSQDDKYAHNKKVRFNKNKMIVTI